MSKYANVRYEQKCDFCLNGCGGWTIQYFGFFRKLSNIKKRKEKKKKSPLFDTKIPEM